MTQHCLQAPTWYHATTLTERLALRRLTPPTPVAAEVDAACAWRRLQRWRAQAPFTSDVCFAQRLALDGLTEEDLLSLLGEPITAVQHRCATPLAWVVDLVDAFARPGSSPLQQMPLETLQGQEGSGFLEAIAPLIGRAREQLHAGVQALLLTHSNPPFTPSTVEALLCAHVPGQLLAMLGRTMILELHVARLQGWLHGDTPEECFQGFMARLRQRETALALLQEYPVLARQLMQYLERWVCVSLEFLRRLCADWDDIRTTFSHRHDPGWLVKIESSVGDTHRGGRSVWIAQFSSGFQLVYKPKSLAVDLHFQHLLTWLNARGDHAPLRTLTVRDCGTYGWVEYVGTQSCHTTAEIQRFYERQGGYLALLYVLEATDFHSENLIAVGEHPVLVDLEALFQPRLDSLNLTHAEDLASQTMAYSVLRVGLLPQRFWADVEHVGVDISGLGAVAGQLTPHSVPAWDAAGTDSMHVVRRRRALSGGDQHRPTLHGAEVAVGDYADAIMAGFTSVYRTLLRYREALLADTGPLACFGADEVRVLLRDTNTYAVLLRESFHPDVLRDALERDRLFDRLWAAVEHRPALARVILAEREDLQHGDIPLFTTRPGSVDLWSSQQVLIAGFFAAPGLAQVRRRIQQLGELDLRQQHWFIRASLATLSPHHGPRSTSPLVAAPAVADRETLLRTACAVGERLETLALRSEQEASWLGLTPAPDRAWSLLPLGIDLYAGLPGVALFLAYLGALTHEERYTLLAQAALRALRHQIQRSHASLTSIGGFDGWGGVIYVLTHLGVLWEHPGLLAEAEAMLAHLPELIACDEQLDVISGAAGCIGSVLSLHRCVPSERTLAVAVECGDRLIARARVMEHGIGWSAASTPQPLAGFSHGAAGMAWALLELFAHTGAERFRMAALDAITYERGLFAPEVGNWPDLREHEAGKRADTEDERVYTTAWCHGAPGIGLARLQALPHVHDAVIHAEIATALQTTLAQGFGHSHSLCHGDLGNLELLVQASAIRQDAPGRVQVYHLAALILASISAHGWRCGTPGGVESPGLMTGLAGIGYGLLRLAEPTRVPSVLTLAPPPSAS